MCDLATVALSNRQCLMQLHNHIYAAIYSSIIYMRHQLVSACIQMANNPMYTEIAGFQYFICFAIWDLDEVTKAHSSQARKH